jgi:hypothetical protein
MGITLVIIGGVSLITFIAAYFDYLGKKKTRNDTVIETRISEIEKKMNSLQTAIDERDGIIEKLESDVRFMTKLIEDKRQ